MDRNGTNGQKRKNILNNCNIFETIDENMVDSTDLALLPGEEEIVLMPNDDDEMILHTESD